MSPKHALRRITRAKRDQLCADERLEKAAAIEQRLFAEPEFGKAGTILFYAAFGSEVPTIAMMNDALMLGKTVVLPITDTATSSLVLRTITDLDHLKPNRYGIPEPVIENTALFDATAVDLVIVPGMVFDEHGGRIGYGGGYYDRFLRQIDPAVPWLSIAFELQIVPRIPSESHDLPVDKIITEERVIGCRDNRIERMRDILGY
ncbi:MAG TPA: 5-formyltetrahydrofolate cyclo-ligase [Candidatus Aquicultor sp.]|jgi:5-formyltetrahydrofolate cyclo-ligase